MGIMGWINEGVKAIPSFDTISFCFVLRHVCQNFTGKGLNRKSLRYKMAIKGKKIEPTCRYTILSLFLFSTSLKNCSLRPMMKLDERSNCSRCSRCSKTSGSTSTRRFWDRFSFFSSGVPCFDRLFYVYMFHVMLNWKALKKLGKLDSIKSSCSCLLSSFNNDFYVKDGIGGKNW